MPILKSAIKKMRQDKITTAKNRAQKEAVKDQIKKFLKEKTVESYNKTASMIDRLAKKKVWHKNKAARLKSRFSKKLVPIKK